jgi:hypothetical protein
MKLNWYMNDFGMARTVALGKNPKISPARVEAELECIPGKNKES